MRVTQVQNILVRFGYCHIKRVKTGPYPALSVVLEKAEGFEEQQEAFQVQIEDMWNHYNEFIFVRTGSSKTILT